MENFTRNQPKDGDNLLHCGHTERDAHFFFVPDGIPFTREPGAAIETAHWIVGCEPCLARVNFEPRNLLIRGSATWEGDAPALLVNPNRPEQTRRRKGRWGHRRGPNG